MLWVELDRVAEDFIHGQMEEELSMNRPASIQLLVWKRVLSFKKKLPWVQMFARVLELSFDLQLQSENLAGSGTTITEQLHHWGIMRDSQWSMRRSRWFWIFVDSCGQVFKKSQTLNARIGNNVEIGANTCIDRGSWRETVIGDCTKIDNLVQIGHNVIIGKNCLLCGQVGIAGSESLGDYVVLGGRAAVKDHVTITSKVRLAANSCVIKDIKDPGDYGGFPAVPIGRWSRQVATCRA